MELVKRFGSELASLVQQNSAHFGRSMPVCRFLPDGLKCCLSMIFTQPKQQRAIQDLIIGSFNLKEIKSVCFELGIDFEDLPGKVLRSKAKELCAYSQRHANVEKLLTSCVRLRPNVDWWNTWNMWNIPIQEQLELKSKKVSASQKREEQDLYKKERLYTILNVRFSMDELDELCFLSNIEWGNLEGQIEKTKVRSIIRYVMAREALDKLISKACTLRSDISASDFQMAKALTKYYLNNF